MTFDSTKKEIDITIPDSAVTKVVKVTKSKLTKQNAETIDNSQICTIRIDIPVKKRCRRRNSGSDAQLVSDDTINSIHGLLGAKMMKKHNHLSSLETAFPVKPNSYAVEHADK